MSVSTRRWVVYGLKDPRDGSVRYIGWTFDEKIRLRDHLKPSALRGASHRSHWLALLVSLGIKPKMEILEAGSSESGWKDAEVRWIRCFREAGAELTNGTDGGDGTLGFRHTSASKAQMSAQRKGKGPSAKAHAAKIAATKGKQRPREIMEPMWAARRQWRMPDEQREILSKLAKRRTCSAETRGKLSAAGKGRAGPKISDAARARLSEERKGKPVHGIQAYWDSLSPEQRRERQKAIYAKRRQKRASAQGDR